MADPHSTLVGIVAGAGASSVSLLLGAQVDALAIGLMAAIFMSIWLDTIDNRIKAAAAVLFSALLAGYASPVAAGWLVQHYLSTAKIEDIRLLLALMIGAITPTIMPIGIKFIVKKISGDKV